MATYTGNTVEEAIERGLKREKIARENAHIEIEQRESKGFLGVGKKRARVSIEPIEEETVRRADRMATRHVDQSDMGVETAESAMEATLRLNKVVKAVREAGIQQDPELTEEEKQEKIQEIKANISDHQEEAPTEVEPSKEVSEEQTAEPVPAAEVAPLEQVQQSVVTPETKEETANLDIQQVSEHVADYLTKITHEMGIETSVTFATVQNDVLQFALHSNHDALLIGKHGKILSSLEILAKALANVESKERLNIRVNVGDYHEKRERYLISLANRAAERALAGETVYINDLPAHERKIIHRCISNIAGVDSHSEGKESKRYIVISPAVGNENGND